MPRSKATTKPKGKPRKKGTSTPPAEKKEERPILMTTDDAMYECQPATDNDGVVITDLVAEHPKEEPKTEVDTHARAAPPEPAPIVPEASAPKDPPAAPPAPTEAPPSAPAAEEPVRQGRVKREAMEYAITASAAVLVFILTPLWLSLILTGAVVGVLLFLKLRKAPAEASAVIEDVIKEEPKPRQLFSDAHPNIYSIAERFLPRLHSLALLFYILFAALGELGRRNYDFIFDWYKQMPILPGLVRVLTVQGAWDQWVQDYGFVTLLISIILAWFIVLFYALVWRYWFKTYWRVANRVESPEGRVYWWTGNMWYRIWDRLWRSPPRTHYVFWIHPRWWPPFNPLNPPSNMIKLTISAGEEVEYRGPWKLWVHERSRRRMESIREYYTQDGYYTSLKIPVRESAETFLTRSREMIQDTHLISLGNPSVRNKQLENCAFPVPAEFKEVIVNARKQDQGREAA